MNDAQLFGTTTNDTSSTHFSIDFGVVGKKVNELVEAVNRLMEKIDEHSNL